MATNIAATAKCQSGLAIKRDGNKWQMTWKIPNTKWEVTSQDLYWATNGDNNSRQGGAQYTHVNLTKAQTKKTVTVDADAVRAFSFYLKSTQKRTVTTGKGKSKKSTVHTVTLLTPVCVWYTALPKSVSVTLSPDADNANVTKATWEVKTSAETKAICTGVKWKTAVTRDGAAPKSWGATHTGGASGSTSFTENYLYDSMTRWIRVWSYGPKGETDPVTRAYTYAQPRVPKINSASAINHGETATVTMTWTANT